MSEWFWKKLDQWVGYGVLLLLLGMVFLQANVEIKDLDLWLHIGAGRYIVENLSIPRVDIFSSTVAGNPWNNHEWLFQVIVYFAHSLAGFDGITALQVVLVSLTFLLLLMLGYRSDKQTGVICLATLVFMVYQQRFTHRPDLFSLLFFVMYIRALSVGLKDKATVLVIFVVQVLWTNIHGFFILGPALLGVALVTEWIKSTVKLPFEWNGIGRIDPDGLRRLRILFFVSVLACFVNPYFIKGALYPLKILLGLGGDSSIFFRNIGELQKPIVLSNIFSLSQYPFLKILIVITFTSFLFNYRRIEIGGLVLSLIFLIMSLKAVRNGSYFAFVAFFAFLSNYQYFSIKDIFAEKIIRRHIPYMFSITVKVLLGLWMLGFFSKASLAGYLDFDSYQRKSEYGGVSLRSYPEKAVDFLVENNIKGKFFNNFNSGAYLIGRAYPNIKVFIDGRTEVYGAEFFREYQKATKKDYKTFKKVVDKYQLTGVFLNSMDIPAPKRIIKGLYDDPEWKLVYFDYDGAIFLKDISQNKEWIKKFEIDFRNWKQPKVDYYRLGLKNASAFREIRLAYGLFKLGQLEKAEDQAHEVLRMEGANAKAFNLLGRIAMERQNYLQALEYLRRAKVLSVKDLEVRENLCECLINLDQMTEAQKQCQNVLARTPRNPKALFLLSRIYVKQQRYSEAIDLAQKAYKIAPYEKEPLMDVAADFKAKNQTDYAKKILSLLTKDEK